MASCHHISRVASNSGFNPARSKTITVSAWEQFFDSNPKPMQVRVQLHDPYRDDHPPISDEVVIDMPGYCGGALAYVVFTQNH